MKREDAESILARIIEVNEHLRQKNIVAIKVTVKLAIAAIASDRNPNHADSFVVHSPNEVFEFMNDA
jgi:hypothetical protein